MENSKQIILASKSPARKLILEKLNIPFSVQTAEVDENRFKNEIKDPSDLVVKLAEIKTEAVAKDHKDAIVVGCDTMVVHNGKIFGKPKDFDEAVWMMMEFAGKEQHIISGFCVVDTKTREKNVRLLDNTVFFKNYTEDEARNYLMDTQPTTRAGAYELKEVIDRGLVEKFVGTPEACSGIDLNFLKEKLQKEGYKVDK